MTINQCAPGCGLARPGEGAVANNRIAQTRGQTNNMLGGHDTVASSVDSGVDDYFARILCPVKKLGYTH